MQHVGGSTSSSPVDAGATHFQIWPCEPKLQRALGFLSGAIRQRYLIGIGIGIGNISVGKIE
ncbi:MAG TPA: hypothetical protein DDY14_04540 [Chromatiaceae bacterium]|nr:MAG: hypothetical protein N838_13275 [Thiohalocapsa sp. PB-PSB1]HBG94593.1 hypothetical protein [Chromatiaceae bacterium]HCS89944.1 hypothetical protein [Chromatiaceae bacterium]